MINFLKNKSKNPLLIFSFFVFFLFTVKANAALLYMELKEEEYYQNDIFMVDIKIDTKEESINAAKVEIKFPQDYLEVVDILRKDSAFSFWPEIPSYSNEKGEISFLGGVPQGISDDKNLVSIPFRVRKKETKEDSFDKIKTDIIFQESSMVLLNDGFGTLADLVFNNASFTIIAKEREVSLNEWEKEIKNDNIPPEPFEISIVRDPLIFDGKYFIFFHTKDLGTGIDYYEVLESERKVFFTGNTEESKWVRTESPYLLKDQSLQSIIKVRAVDKAGNERMAIFTPDLDLSFYGVKYLYFGIILIIVLLISYIIFKKRKNNILG